ncbi:MAG: DUF1080 domain-containing protein [Cyclobacteriaceae bacterium]
MKHFKRLNIFSYCLILVSLLGCDTKENQRTNQKQRPVRPSLSSLDDFKPSGDNWIMVGEPIFGMEKPDEIKYTEGASTFLNLNNQETNKHLFSKMEHADIDLELEVMMPKGSNSGIYFQSRYEIQLLDSWGKKTPKHSDIGGIYQRWNNDLPDGEKGYEGIAPPVNAAKAPGVWQHLSISFVAPRFNDRGEKISNAMFRKVVLNGVVLHENKELSGPTRGAAFGNEAAMGSLMIQGDHGPVALRNIKYKAYQDIQLDIQDLTFKYAEGEFFKVPNFDTLDVLAEGKAESFHHLDYASRSNGFAIQFEGTLKVPNTGIYTFDLITGDGTKLFIDNKLVAAHDGRHWMSKRTGNIQLNEGEHTIRVAAFEYKHVSAITIGYEGPGIRYQYLPSTPPRPALPESEHIFLKPESKAILQRCFIDYKGRSVTLAVAVGDPDKLHYTVDLETGSMLKSWRGDFADMTGMWHSRGETQQLLPVGTTIDGCEGLLINQLYGLDTPWNPKEATFKHLSYKLADQDRPIFKYAYKNSILVDRIVPDPSNSGFTRTLTLQGNDRNIYARIAKADFINDLGNGLYSIQNLHYIKLDPKIRPHLRQSNGASELLIPVIDSVSYSIIW